MELTNSIQKCKQNWYVLCEKLKTVKSNFGCKLLILNVSWMHRWKIASFELTQVVLMSFLFKQCTRTRTTDAQWSLLKLQTFGLGLINLGAFEVFLAALSAPILVLWVTCPCFPLINHYFYKKLSFFIQIPNIYLELVFEFRSQRIRDLAILCS